jgi:hypothetical protein
LAQVYAGVGANDQHNAYDADVANSFYNLATEVTGQQNRRLKRQRLAFERVKSESLAVHLFVVVAGGRGGKPQARRDGSSLGISAATAVKWSVLYLLFYLQ